MKLVRASELISIEPISFEEAKSLHLFRSIDFPFHCISTDPSFRQYKEGKSGVWIAKVEDYSSKKEVIAAMENVGLRPANLPELLGYSQLLRKKNELSWVISLAPDDGRKPYEDQSNLCVDSNGNSLRIAIMGKDFEFPHRYDVLVTAAVPSDDPNLFVNWAL